MAHELAPFLADMHTDLKRELGYVAQALETANKLKAIELSMKTDPKFLEKPEVQDFLRQIAYISKK